MEKREIALSGVYFLVAFVAVVLLAMVGLYFGYVSKENQPVTFSVKVTFAKPQNVTIPLPEGYIEPTVESFEITIIAPRGYMEGIRLGDNIGRDDPLEWSEEELK